MTDARHPRRSELERPEDMEMDALQARLHRLEQLLREVQRDYVGNCHPRCRPGCMGARIQAELGASP